MAGVYISYPFCAQKCTYCNFASGVFPPGLEAHYIEALRSEIARHAWQWRPETVYIGGGTPSLMDIEVFCQLFEAIPGRPWSEATIEAAPGSLDAEKVSGWVRCGVNRVSLGVQSFVERELARTGSRLSENDNWIAATARTWGLRLVSRDEAFTRVPRLDVVSY